MTLKDRVNRFFKAHGFAHLAGWKSPDGDAFGRWLQDQKLAPVAKVDAFGVPPEVRRYLGEVLDLGEGGPILDELVLPFIALLFPQRDQEEVLDEMKGCISDAHLKMLRQAMVIENFHSSGLHEKATIILASAERTFGEDARKIFNLYGAGYVENLLLFELQMMKYENERLAPERFRKFFEEKLKFFDGAIFVNARNTRDDVFSGLRERLVVHAHPQAAVTVWTASRANIDRVAAYLDEWVGDGRHYNYNVSLSKKGKNAIISAVVYNVQKAKTMRPSRLSHLWEDPR